MNTLALVNQKGGCGKTTAAINLAGALAARGRRVLLIDLDPQAHATLGLGCAPCDEPTLMDVLLGKVSVDDALFDAPGGVRLLAATSDLSEFEDISARLMHAESALAAGLEAMETEFDEVILDCPPRVDGILARNALRAADTAVLVVETGAFALQGAVQAMGVLDELTDDISAASFDRKVLGTMFDRRTRFARELLIALHARFGPAMFDTVIRTSVRLREAAAHGAPVQVLDPACRACGDFAALAEEWVAFVESDVRRGAVGARA
ncbi:MAG TPA: ParA family protein [Planctomycetota bacterium]|jgi:chromosome partitioning protein|nr:ParA family protein [Planctomycetota bacterium]